MCPRDCRIVPPHAACTGRLGRTRKARVLDVSVPEVAPARLAHLLESIAEGWASGKIPPETYVRPHMNSIYLLNRRNVSATVEN